MRVRSVEIGILVIFLLQKIDTVFCHSCMLSLTLYLLLSIPTSVGPFKDYAYSCIQFGYVVFFASVVPLIGCLALVENLIKIRTDAVRSMLLLRRPFVEMAEDVGMWTSLMKAISTFGFVVNIAIIVFSTNSYDNLPVTTKALYFLVGEQLLMIYTLVLSATFPSPPGWLKDIEMRNEFVVDKYVHGVDEDDDENVMISRIGDPEDPVDQDRLEVYGMRGKIAENP